MPALPQVALEEEGDSQRVRLTSTLRGRLLLHWGVEGGEDYKSGWRLPGTGTWPEGTVRYKDRALQTPWKCDLCAQACTTPLYSSRQCPDAALSSFAACTRKCLHETNLHDCHRQEAYTAE